MVPKMNHNPIEDKSFSFAVRSVNLYKYLNNKKEYVLPSEATPGIEYKLPRQMPQNTGTAGKKSTPRNKGRI